MCRAKTLAQNRSVFGNAEVNVDVRYSLTGAAQAAPYSLDFNRLRYFQSVINFDA